VPYGGGSAEGPGINGVKSCILAISWQQNWPFRNYNLITEYYNSDGIKFFDLTIIFILP
jgi:hypothetical protein